MRKIIAGLLMIAVVFPLLIAIMGMVSIMTIADTINFSTPFAGVPDWSSSFTTTNGIDAALAAVGIIALLVTVFIAANSTHDRLLWMGSALLVPSLLMLGLAFAINSEFVGNVVSYSLAATHYDGFIYAQSRTLGEAILSADATLLRVLAGSFSNTGIIVSAVAVLLFVLGSVITDQYQNSQKLINQ
jgi:hypothetical protein